MLGNLGENLTNTMKKLVGMSVIDKKTIKEVVKDIQRALIQSDVNIKLVLDLSKKIEERALEEEPPKGITPREHVITIIYEEMVNQGLDNEYKCIWSLSNTDIEIPGKAIKVKRSLNCEAKIFAAESRFSEERRFSPFFKRSFSASRLESPFCIKSPQKISHKIYAPFGANMPQHSFDIKAALL